MSQKLFPAIAAGLFVAALATSALAQAASSTRLRHNEI